MSSLTLDECDFSTYLHTNEFIHSNESDGHNGSENPHIMIGSLDISTPAITRPGYLLAVPLKSPVGGAMVRRPNESGIFLRPFVTSNLPSVASLLGGRPLKMITFAVLFLALSASVPYLIWQELSAQTVALQMPQLSVNAMLAILGLLMLYYLSDALRLWSVLLALGVSIKARRMIPLVFINLLFSNISPMATGGGLIQIWYMKRHGVHLGEATAATTLRTVIASLLIFLPAPLLLVTMNRLQDTPLAQQWVPWFVLFATVYVGFFFCLIWRLRWFIGALGSLLDQLYRLSLISHKRLTRWQFKLRKEMLRFGRSFRAFLTAPPSHIALALLSTALFLLSLFSFPALLLWALGYEVNFTLVIALMLINTFIMYFAPTPGAAGVAEGIFTLFFATMVEQQDLLLMVLAWRFLTVHLGMLIGVPVTIAVLLKRGTDHA